MQKPRRSSPSANSVLRQPSRLEPKARARIANLLIESRQEEEEPDVADAWDAEIKRRVDAVKSGKAKLVPWEKVRAELRDLVRKPR